MPADIIPIVSDVFLLATESVMITAGDPFSSLNRWALLLDLDDTLVLTGMIEHLRRQRAWGQVYQSLSLTRLPPGTHGFLRAASKISRLGVVTTSPRTYAERLLKHHKIDIPVLVAYHDVSRRKPHPEPVLKAADLVRVSPAHSIYVGDQIDDIKAAAYAGAVPVGLSWDRALSGQNGAEQARAICTSWKQVYRLVVELIEGDGG